MPKPRRWAKRVHRRVLALATTTIMLATLLSVVAGTPAAALPTTTVYNEPFKNNTLGTAGSTVFPTATGGNAACLTAAGGGTSCTTNTDANGSGFLRLASSTAGQMGGAFGSATVAAPKLLDVTFNLYSWNAGTAADGGMTFVLAAANPASPAAPASLGYINGALGYTGTSTAAGLPNGYLGIGFDAYGNYSNSANQGSGCTNPAYISTTGGTVPGQVVVRGPGTGTVGYCAIKSTATTTTSPALNLRGSTRAASRIPAEVVINPTAASITTTSGLTVAAMSYLVAFTPVGGSQRTLTGTLPSATSILPAAYLDANGIPKLFTFGWIGNNGSTGDFREIDAAQAATFDVPVLAVSTTSYTAASPATGAPVNYVVTPTVNAGANVTGAISVTQTTPSGVRPVAAFGTGWVCAAPGAQAITCTTTATSFTNGTTLPTITVVAIVTSAGVTATTVQASSPTTVSSPNTTTGSATTTIAGTVAATPTGVAVSPTSGPTAGGNAVTISGTNISGATAIEIGTTAEQQAGTPVVLVKCPGAAAAGCFTISGNNVLISSMPARAGGGSVTITAVTLGVAGAVSYLYTNIPGIPATPTATAGLNSVTLSWVAPPNNGSVITRYVVTPYLGGVAQTALSLDPAATIRVINGLTPGGSYTFKVAATNAVGTSAASALSAAAVPYSATATAPTAPTVTAGNSAATLTWSAPTDSRPVTGYIVTPYIGTTAQATQSFTGSATTRTVTGLTPGTAYSFTVTAQSALTTNVLYRVNAGGPALAATDGGISWSNDTADTPLHNSGSNAVEINQPTSADSTIPAGTPMAMFDSERWDPGVKGDGAEMKWTFPVTSGVTTKVRLYISNRCTCTATIGLRQFDVALEGTTVLDNFDPLAANSVDHTATMREFAVTSDGNIVIDFGHEVDAPLINGIEIIQTGLPSTGPASAKSASVTPNVAPTLTFAAPPAGQVAVAYSNQLTVNGGTPPIAWSVSTGTLPPGLTLSAAGLLSGTPTAGGSYPFTVLVTDATGATASRAVTLVIAAAPVVTFTPGAGELSVAYSQQPTVTGGTAPFSWALTAGSLPAGVTLNQSTGLVSGTPTAFGNFSVTLSATDARSQVSNATATIVIAALPTLTFAAPTAGQVGVPYSVAFTAAGGTAPLTWSISTGSLPAGLTLNTGTGVLSGTPTTVASSSFTVSVVDAYNKSAAKAATIAINAGPLVILKTASATSTVAGGTVSYTITLTNTGSTAFTGVALSDPLTGVLDDAAYDANATASSGVVSYASSTVSWAGDVAPSAVITITYSVTVNNPDLGNKVLANTVTSSTLGTNCATGSIDTRCTATITVAGLSIVKTADVATTTPGSVVQFSVAITNTGPATYSGATFTDNLSGVLDDAVYNTNGTNGGVGSVSYTSPSLSWTGNLAAGATATITYSVTIANPDTGNRSLTGIVVSTSPGSNCASGTPAATCSATVTVLIPALVINNSISTAVPTLLGHWAFDEGTGATAADSGGSHPVTLGAGAGWTPGMQGPSAMSANNTVTGYASTAAAVLNTAASFSVSARVKLTTVDGYQTVVSQDGNQVSGFYLQLRGDTGRFAFARLGSDAAQPTPAFPSALAAPVAGQWYQLTGVYNAADSSLSLYINGQLQQTTAAPAAWNAGGNLIIGRGKYGGSPVEFFNGAIDDVQVYSGVVVGGGALTTPGSAVSLTTTISNGGQTAYSATSVTLALPAATDDALYNNDATASSGTVVYNSAAGTLVWTGNLGIGAVVIVTSSMTVRNPDPGDKLLTTVASSAAAGSTCPAGSAASACTATVPVKIPALTITKAANVSTTTPGSVVQYTVLVTNNGQTNYTGAAFADNLAGVLDDSSYDNNAVATAGSVSFSNTTVSWTGNLVVGATATITFSVTVNNPDNGNKTLVAAVTSTTSGNNCAAGSLDSRCNSTVAVLIPGLSIGMAGNAVTVTPGSAVSFDVTVTNTGQTTYSGVAIDLNFLDVLDDATYNNDGVTSTGSLVVNTDGSAQWILTLAPGQSSTATTSFTVNSPVTGNKSMVASVTSGAPGSTCPTGSNLAPCRGSVAIQVPGLTITKTASAPTVVTGGTVNYTILVVNSGESTYPAAAFTDSLAAVLDDASYLGGATATSGTVTYSAPTISWTGNLAPGATATITYSVTVSDPDNGDKRLSNTAVSASAGSNCAVGSIDIRCTAAVDVLVPRLTVVKTSNTPSTTPGAVVGYTVTVTNSGATPYTGAAFSDTLTGVLDDAAYNANAAATAGTASYASSTVSWIGDLAIGAVATITYSVTVNAADVGNDLLTSTITSATPGNNCSAGSGDTRCGVTVPVARLIIAKAATPATTTPGSTITLATTFTNTGQVAYTGITLSNPTADLLDDVNANGDQTATSGSLVVTPTTHTWTGSIPVGGSVSITATFTVKNPDPGNKVINSPWVSTAPGNNCPAAGSDPRCTTIITVLTPGLAVSTTASSSSVAPGGVVGYTISVRNSGETAYTGVVVTDVLTGVLDDASYNADASTATGTLSYASPALTWTGDLAVGATAIITFSATANNPRTGDNTMLNQVQSTAVGSSCPVASGNPACQSSVDVLAPALTISKTADHTNAALGSTVTYTVAVTNTGQTSYPAAQFTDSLAAVLDDATYNPAATTTTRGTTTYTNGVLSWSGALTPGQTATITYTATVNNPATGNRTMSNTIASTTDGNNCATASTDTRCTTTVAITNSVALVLTKTANVATTTADSVVTYTVTMTNSTPSPITAANFTDPLNGILDDATYNTDATATTGTITYTNPNLTWTGTIAAQSTITLTYSVTVHTAITGNQILTSTLTSTTQPASNNCAATSTDPQCTNTVPVARLELSQTAAETSATPGSIIHLTAVYTNTGQVPYNSISIASPRADTADDTIPTGDQTATSGTLERTTTAITWTGNIPIGGTVTVLRTLTVKNPDPGNQIITATLNSTAPGNNCHTGTTDPPCTFAVTVLTPALTITKTADTPTSTPGGTVQYTITIHNTGQTPYPTATITDNLTGILDDANYNNNATTTTGTITYNNPTLTWTGNLPLNATTTITYTTTTNAGTGDKTMINTVTSTNTGNTCPPATPNPNCRTTITILTPALTITTTANVANSTLGTTVGYTVIVTNTGQTAYSAAAFTESLAGVLDDATFNPASTVASVGATGYSEGVLSWSGSLSPGASATITYSVTINNPSTGDRSLTSAVVSTSAGTNCPADSTDTRCATTVGVTNSVALTFTKTADVSSTVAGGTVLYTARVVNSSASDILVADFTVPLTGVLDDAAFNGDAAASSGAVQYTAPNLTWSGSVPAGATITVTYSVAVNSAVTGNQVLSDQLSSTSLPGSNNCAAGSTDPRCLTTVPIARLLLQQSYAEASTTPGSVIHLSATFTNTGAMQYNGITVVSPIANTIDDAIPNGDQEATSGSLVLTASAITWSGSIPVGGVVTVTGTLTVANPDPGNRIVTGTLASTAPGNNCPAGGTDWRCTALVTVSIPELTISNTANTTNVAPGGVVGYTISVRNSGETAYTGVVVTDVLTGVLDDASYNADAATATGTLSYASPALTWTGDLAVGATAIITFSATANNPRTGDNTMLNQVQSTAVGSSCPVASGNPACQSSVDVLAPALTISKTADHTNAALGSTVTYTVAVTNTGQTSYPAAQFTDSLAAVLDDATYNPAATTTTRGTTTYTNGVLSWSGALTPGQTATITYTATVNNPATGNRTMSNTIASTTDGNNCATASTDTRCTTTVAITNSVALVLTKTANVATTTADSVVTYTVTMTNSTPSPITAANFTDPLNGILDDATYNTDATATTGTITYTNPNLTWTGTIAAQSTITLTYSVTVHTAITGNQILTSTLTSTTQPASNNCAATSTDPQCTNTVPVARLELSQTAAETSATPGSIIHLTAVYTNTGQVPYNSISIASPRADTADDTIPTGDQTATSGTLERTTTAITWTGNIPIGGTVTVLRTLTVKNPDPGNQIITATLNSTAPGNNCHTGTTDPPCTFAVTVLTPALTITKTADTPTSTPGGTVQYTITIHNTGQTPYPTATITDNLTGILDDANYNNNATTTTGTITYNNPTLTWTGNLPLNATTTITYTTTTNAGTGDKTMINTVTSTNTGNTCPPATPNPNCRTTITILTPALTITTTANSATTVPGGTVIYTVTAANTGQTSYPAANFSVPLEPLLDEADYNGDVTASSGTVGDDNEVITWTGAIAVGATVTLTYSVTVATPAGGDYRLEQAATSTSQGSNCAADSTDPRCATSVAVASLHIASSADVATTKPTGVVEYTSTFINTGQVPYVGITIVIDVADVADDAAYNGDATASAGSVNIVPGAPQVSWTGDLAVGATVTFSASVTVNNPDLGNGILTNHVFTDAAASNCPAGGDDPICVNSVTVLTPGLTIVQAASTNTTTPGGVVGYTITVTNSGETHYTAAVVTDSLASILTDAAYGGDATASGGTVDYTAAVLTWTGDLAPDDVVVIGFTVTVNNPDLGDKSMVNRVVSNELGSSCPTTGSISACATTVAVLVPALDITITADSSSTTPGSVLAYTVTVRNIGQTDYLGADVTIGLAGVLDDAAEPQAAIASTGSITFESPNLTWTGDLDVGATATIGYTVMVHDPDTGNQVLATSVGSASPGGSCPEATPCINEIAVLTPGLAVSTTANRSTATPGDQVTFTISISNTGQAPYAGTTVATNLAGITDDAGFDGIITASSGVAGYTAPNLTWTGSLPVGAAAVITYTVTINNPDPGDKLLTTTVVASAVGSTCPDGSSNSACTASVTVLVPALTITQTANATAVIPGTVVVYTVAMTNAGQTDYTAITITDSLVDALADAAYNNDAAVVGGGLVGYSAPVLSWTGDLLIGATATITYSVTVRKPDPGDKNIVNSVSSTAPGSSCRPGVSLGGCSTVVSVLIPKLTVTQTADRATVVAGSAVHYTVTLFNSGEYDYPAATFSDALTGILDDATYTGDATANVGATGYDNSTLSWTGALAIGATATITFSVTANYPATGDRAMQNRIISSSQGSNCLTGVAALCNSTVGVLVPALLVTKAVDTSSIVAGGTVGYTISATNTGQADYPTMTLTDSLVGVIDDATYSNNATATIGTVSYTAPALSWTGALSIGATVTITYTVTTNDIDTGDATLDNRVMSTSVGNNCTADSPDPRCAAATTIEGRTIGLAGLTPAFTLNGVPDATVTSNGAVTMTVTSNGPVGYTVTVQAATDALTTATPGEPVSSIPIAALEVRESGTTQFQPMSVVPQVVHQQTVASAPDGDAVSNDYRISIPFVAADTYSATLEYIVTAQ